jgi:hypothetical protein
MNQAAGEPLQQQPLPPLCDLVNEAYALVPCRRDFASHLVQQEATSLTSWCGLVMANPSLSTPLQALAAPRDFDSTAPLASALASLGLSTASI